MRLIDADKLLPKLWVCYEENKPIVDAEPTVEAIPIVYIRRVMAHWKEYDSEFDGFWWGALDRLVEMWEKENAE